MTQLTDHARVLFSNTPHPDKHYYAFSMHLSESSGVEFGTQTRWVGYTEEEPRREIREASLVFADRMLSAWREIGQDGAVVNDVEDMALYLAFGGNALVEEQSKARADDTRASYTLARKKTTRS